MTVAGVRWLVLLILVGLVAAACGDPPAAPVSDDLDGGQDGGSVDVAGSDAPVEGGVGGTVRIGYAGSPDSLNPGNGVLEEAYFIYEMTYDTLITLDLNGA